MPSRHPAVCSWSLRPANPFEMIAAIQYCRLQQVQLALVPLIKEAEWGLTHVLLQDAGIKIISGMFATIGEDYSSLATIAETGGIRPDATWNATWELAQQVADAASEMQLPLVTMHAGFLPEEQCDERDKMIHRLRQLGDLFGDKGINIALETGQETADNLVAVLEELSHPSIGVNFDPANMILYGMGDPVEAIRTLTPWVHQVHIKDAIATDVPGTWGTEVPVGTGEVHWEEFLDAVPDGIDLVIEREAGDERVEDIIAAASYIDVLTR